MSIESKRISDALAQEIRGAFLCIWCFTFLIVALTVASIALSYVSPTLGKILGYAAMVAGVIGIIGSLTSWVVQGAKMVFSQIVQQGVLQTVKQGILAIGKILVAPIHYAGRFIQNGFAFIKEGFSKGLAKMGQGLSNLKNFLLNPKGLPVVDAFGHNILGTNGQILRHFSIEQIIARQVVAAGINYTVSKGLEGLGLNPVIARLGGAFLGSGFLGIGAETTSFIKSGLQGLLLKGVSEMGLHLDLPPPVTSAISLAANASLKSFFDSNLTLRTSLEQIAPKAAAKLALGGLDLIARSLGLDPRITALIGIPVSATVEGLMNGLGFGTGQGGGGPGGILQAIKSELFSTSTLGGLVSIGAEVLANALDVNPLLVSLGLRGLAGGIEGLTDRSRDGDAIGRFLGGVGGALKESAMNIVTLGGENATDVQRTLYVAELVDLATKKGSGDLFDIFEQYANQILGRDTVESIFATGKNISQYFKERRAAGEFTVRMLEDGRVVHEYIVNNHRFVLDEDETQILARHFGNHAESGQYGIDSQGRYVLINGQLRFTNGAESMTITVRNAQVASIDMVDSQGRAVTFFGTPDQPLVLKSNPGNVFTVQSGIVRNWDTGETRYYTNGRIAATQNIHFLDFKNSAGELISGSIQIAQHLDIEGRPAGFETYIDNTLRQELIAGNLNAAQSFWDFAINNQRTDSIAQNHVPWLQTFNITRYEIANNADAVVDKIFDFVKPQTGSTLEDILLFQQTASVEIMRAVIKGFVDTLRIGDRLDEIVDDATGAWRDIHDGNLSDAGKKLLSLSGNSFIELMRVLDLALIGGGVRSALSSGATVIKTQVADFVGRLLRRSDDIAESMLGRIFKNNSLKGRFLTETKSIDDVAAAFKKGYLGVDDVKNFKLFKAADDVNASLRASNPNLKDPYLAGSRVTERITIAEEEFVRFWAEGTTSGPTGKWLVRKAEVNGLTPVEIKDLLGLEYMPTHFTNVIVPKGTRIREGIVGPITDWQVRGGGFQAELLEQIPESAFDLENLRRIGDVF